MAGGTGMPGTYCCRYMGPAAATPPPGMATYACCGPPIGAPMRGGPVA